MSRVESTRRLQPSKETRSQSASYCTDARADTRYNPSRAHVKSEWLSIEHCGTVISIFQILQTIQAETSAICNLWASVCLMCFVGPVSQTILTIDYGHDHGPDKRGVTTNSGPLPEIAVALWPCSSFLKSFGGAFAPFTRHSHTQCRFPVCASCW